MRVVTQAAANHGVSLARLARPEEPARNLHYLRATGLAQVRLQLAVLSGNRRRALEQIDRLVALDKELERMGGTGAPPLGHDDLAGQRLAIAAEKLALTSQVNLPRLEPAFGAEMGTALAAHEEVEIVEDEVLAGRFARVLLWASGLLVLSLGVGAAAVTQL